jgi:hypothetical protein
VNDDRTRHLLRSLAYDGSGGPSQQKIQIAAGCIAIRQPSNPQLRESPPSWCLCLSCIRQPAFDVPSECVNPELTLECFVVVGLEAQRSVPPQARTVNPLQSGTQASQKPYKEIEK